MVAYDMISIKVSVMLFSNGVQPVKFEQLKQALVFVPLLVRRDFSKAFILDVDWFARELGLFYPRKMEGRNV